MKNEELFEYLKGVFKARNELRDEDSRTLDSYNIQPPWIDTGVGINGMIVYLNVKHMYSLFGEFTEFELILNDDDLCVISLHEVAFEDDDKIEYKREVSEKMFMEFKMKYVSDAPAVSGL